MTDIYTVYQEFYDHGQESDDDPDCDDARLIGIYSTHEKAEAAVERFHKIAETTNRPNAINIYPARVDRDGWTGGFVQI